LLVERSEFQQAQDYLEENLYDSSLNPQNAVWKESLFELGRNYYQKGEKEFSRAEVLRQNPGTYSSESVREILEKANNLFTKSIDRLGEWLKRYPEDSRRFETLYSIGKAYQMAAQYPEFLLKDGRPTSTEVQKQRLSQYRDLVKNARSTFEQIRTGMNDREIGSIPSSSLRSLLRNSYFAEADLTYQLQEYENALTLYRSVANRFLAEPESLEALTQAAECLKKLGRNDESRRVIAQAREILAQIPPEQDSRFISVTRFSRRQWNELLSRMEPTIY
jgi:tetratricopeptide (TPR) repeat protein